ncbi:unnamed protein product [Leuciscus chuanchicus]
MRPASLNLERGGCGRRPSTLSGGSRPAGPPLNLDCHSTWSGGRRPATATQLGAGGRGRPPLNLERGGGGWHPSTWSGESRPASLNLEPGGGGPLNLDSNSTWTATQLGPPLNLDRHSTCSGGRRRPSTWSGGEAAGVPQLLAGGMRPATLNNERGESAGIPQLGAGGGGPLKLDCHSTWSGGEGATATQLGAWGRRLASLNLERGESSDVPQLGAGGMRPAGEGATATQLEAGHHLTWTATQLGAVGGGRQPPLNLERGGGGDRHSTWSVGEAAGIPQLGAGRVGRRPSTWSRGEEAHSTWTATQLGPPLNLDRHSTWIATQLVAGGGGDPQLGAGGRRPASRNL